ncbi:MAG TPA: hypothetical protein VG188_03250, partial [Solirubrobacteraceae bacterium]|nr:hypothetical protein [Solirubrobacteraceae bacterium]
MLERFQRLLDHRYLSRIGNLETLLKWGTAIALVLVGAAVVLFELITHAGVVADVFFAAAFLLVVVLIIRSVATRLRGRSQGADRLVPPPE